MRYTMKNAMEAARRNKRAYKGEWEVLSKITEERRNLIIRMANPELPGPGWNVVYQTGGVRI